MAVLPAADFPADVPGGILPAAVPLSLYATAGVRQLDAGPRDQLMGFVNEYFEASIFAQADHRTISGKEEALFGWLAASYLRNSIADGYVEMGGASAQIAFRVDPDALAGYDAAAAGTQVAEVVIGPFGSAMLLASYPLGSNEGRRRYDTRLANDAAFRDANGVCTCPRVYSSDEAVELISSQIILDGSKPNWFEGQIGGMVVHGASANNPRFVRMVNTVLDFFLPQDLPHPSIGDAPGEIVRTLNFVAGAGFFHSMQVAGNLPVIFQQHYNAMRAMKAEMTPAQMKYDPLFKVVWNRWVLQHVFRITTTDTAAVQLANHVDFLPFNGIEGLELSWTLGRLICVALGGAFPALVD